MSDCVRATLRIWGVVQGVGYRYFVRKAATALNVEGCVRNRADGSVDVVAEGERAAVKAFIEDLRVGSRYSSVERIDVGWEEATGDFQGFNYAF
jgi:acylphosphatase